MAEYALTAVCVCVDRVGSWQMWDMRVMVGKSGCVLFAAVKEEC